MAKYRVKSMYWGNGNDVLKSGTVIDESKVVGGQAKLEQAVKEGFLVAVSTKEK